MSNTDSTTELHTRIRATLRDWFVDVLFSRWIVSREDYNRVQQRAWSAEEYLRQTEKRLMEVMDEAYQPFRSITDWQCEKVEFIEHVEHDIPAFHWAVRIPQARFVSMRELPTREYLIRHFVELITRAFRQHISEKLFKLSEPGSAMRAGQSPVLSKPKKSSERNADSVDRYIRHLLRLNPSKTIREVSGNSE